MTRTTRNKIKISIFFFVVFVFVFTMLYYNIAHYSLQHSFFVALSEQTFAGVNIEDEIGERIAIAQLTIAYIFISIILFEVLS